MKFAMQVQISPNMQHNNIQADISIASPHVAILQTCTHKYIRPTHKFLLISTWTGQVTLKFTSLIHSTAKNTPI